MKYLYLHPSGTWSIASVQIDSVITAAYRRSIKQENLQAYPANVRVMQSAVNERAWVAVVSNAQITNYSTIASLTWITYDIIIRLDDEVGTTSQKFARVMPDVYAEGSSDMDKWTFPKVLYILCRYLGPLWLSDHPLTFFKLNHLQNCRPSCKTAAPISTMGPILFWLFADMIVLLRLRALHLEKINTTPRGLAPEPWSTMIGCWSDSINPNAITFAEIVFISIMAVHTLFLCLLVYKFRENCCWLGKFRAMSLMEALLAEGVFYYIGSRTVVTVVAMIALLSLVLPSWNYLADLMTRRSQITDDLLLVGWALFTVMQNLNGLINMSLSAPFYLSHRQGVVMRAIAMPDRSGTFLRRTMDSS
ncbi:hypothetical protein CVT26_002593 [Gymnopilus dilepis]|uniref:DUF6533 domain-containing protein n=1 Tax=Gymnopilus dilepis TaxID=231916 RepID=A0A409VF47_9AGAR|nr:hypothetical protein CVT26_002593 [Gymnopilus dilepis]